MKKTQFIDLFTTIKKTIVSFSAIVVFIALGLAFYGGVAWGIDHAQMSYTQTAQSVRGTSLDATAPFSFTEEEIEKLTELEDIDEAEGYNAVYRFFEYNGIRHQSQIITLTENINQLLHVEGQLPTARGEAAVLRSFAEEFNLQIGDTIELSDNNAVDYRNYQSIRDIAKWNGENLDELNISEEDPGYLTTNTLTITAIVDAPNYLAVNLYTHTSCSTNGLNVDAVFYVTEDTMPIEAFGGYTGITLYSEKLSSMNNFSEEYQDLSNDLKEQVQNKLNSYNEQIIQDFNHSVEKLKDKLDTIQFATGQIPAELEELYNTLKDMGETLEENEETISYVSDLNTNRSYIVAKSLTDLLSNSRSILGITFLAFGALICYSVISRLVADSAVQIGTRKALGFYKKEITRFYLCYVFIALILGGLLGFLIGLYGIEFALVKVFSSLFTFTSYSLTFDAKDILIPFAVNCVLIILITIVCCSTTASASALSLLQGNNENKFKESFVQRNTFFKKLSLLNQTVITNLTRDKQRVFGMIVGIAGATMLMCAGLTFYLNFTSAFDKEFENYYLFDYQVCYDSNSETASQQIREILDEYQLNYAELYCSSIIVNCPDESTTSASIIIPEKLDELAEVMHFTTESQEETNYDEGLWIGEFYQYAYDQKPGNLISLKSLNGKEAGIEISHFYRHYLTAPVVIMDQSTYQSAFDEEVKSNSFYVNAAGVDINELTAKFEEVDGYIFTYNKYDSFVSGFESEKIVTAALAGLFILMAVLMALMMIVNLLNVYISEKKRELIILIINGYDRKFAKRYVYMDTIFLTIVSVLLGLVTGSILGDKTLSAIEGNSMHTIHQINWTACAIAAIATVALTFIICSFTLHKIDKFKLSDINKD